MTNIKTKIYSFLSLSDFPFACFIISSSLEDGDSFPRLLGTMFSTLRVSCGGFLPDSGVSIMEAILLMGEMLERFFILASAIFSFKVIFLSLSPGPELEYALRTLSSPLTESLEHLARRISMI